MDVCIYCWTVFRIKQMTWHKDHCCSMTCQRQIRSQSYEQQRITRADYITMIHNLRGSLLNRKRLC